MKVLSLFDGMACGMLAMMSAGIEVERYDAYEIDKYAIKVATHNFPSIVEHGDVFEEGFTEYAGVDWLIGGSPCTYWSIAQTKNRETVASGLGWGLSCPDIIAKVIKDFYENPTEVKKREYKLAEKPKTSGEVCPDCGSELTFEGGCNTCKNCGWSKCG